MISIAAQLIDQITKAAQEAYPNECCGLLAGMGNLDGAVSITQVRTSANLAKGSTQDHFEVDPKVHFDLIRELEGTNEQIIGHYHSHPNHPARPSEEDLKMAFEPKLLWLIVGLDESHIYEVTVHRISNDTMVFQEMPLTIVTKEHR
jgi:proteasome lid subunit RPN8/RPN11